MSLTWEPRWEPVVIEYAGIRIRTCKDKITNMIACPICINAAKECLNIKNPPKIPEDEIDRVFFFSPIDLIMHIKNHRRIKSHRGRAKKLKMGEP